MRPTPRQPVASSQAATPPISVAIATYNGGLFIREQLETLASQTLLPAELVVTDDGSEDDTLPRLEHFAAHAPFTVKIVRNPQRLGWRGNFMKAAGLCRSELIAFCDQDDWWYPAKLATLAGCFSDPAVLLAYHDADVVDRDGRTLGTLRSSETDQARLSPRARPTTWSYPGGLTQMFRRVLLDFQNYWPLSRDHRDPTSNAAHDQWYYYLAANLGHVCYMPDRLLAYRQHAGNTVGFRHPAERAKAREAVTFDRGAAYCTMLEAFCHVLETAERDGVAATLHELPAALDTNRQLLRRMQQDRLAHHDLTLMRRLVHFAALVNAKAYSPRTTWNLGYRALLNAALVGVPFGR